MSLQNTSKSSHNAVTINGRSIAQRLRGELKLRVDRLKEEGVTPKLGVILVGGHPPSQIYVKYKLKAAAEIGILTTVHQFEEGVSLDTLNRCVDDMNEDPELHGILVQLPIPHVTQEEMWSVVERVLPSKDVDGLHPLNQGLIGIHSGAIDRSTEGFVACTPLGCLQLLRDTIGDLTGKRAVVVGRSRIVGKPMAALLTAAHATVTLCHSRTVDLSHHLRQAEIIVAAAGIPHLIKAKDISPQAIIIDVGIHRLETGKLCGDVDFDDVKHIATAITPVPGGVGPMTIASLMNNVCLSAERQVDAHN